MPWLLYAPLAWWDRRKPREKRDAWGPWGAVFAVAILDIGTLLSLLLMGLHSALVGGASTPPLAFALLNGAFLAVFFLYAWAAWEGRRRRQELGYGVPPG